MCICIRTDIIARRVYIDQENDIVKINNNRSVYVILIVQRLHLFVSILNAYRVDGFRR